MQEREYSPDEIKRFEQTRVSDPEKAAEMAKTSYSKHLEAARARERAKMVQELGQDTLAGKYRGDAERLDQLADEEEDVMGKAYELRQMIDSLENEDALKEFAATLQRQLEASKEDLQLVTSLKVDAAHDDAWKQKMEELAKKIDTISFALRYLHDRQEKLREGKEEMPTA